MRLDGYRIRPWTAGDETAFTPRADFAAEARVVAWDWSKGAPGPTWTVLHGDHVLAIGGGVRRYDNVWDLWASAADLRPRAWLISLMFAAGALAELRRRHGAKIFAVSCRADFAAGRRCLERLGFAHPIFARDGRLPDVALVFMHRTA